MSYFYTFFHKLQNRKKWLADINIIEAEKNQGEGAHLYGI